MDQSELNRARIDEWDSQGIYDEKFRLRLTSKHRLAVGRWEIKGEWGVDLRRWSFDLARLLLAGITLDSKTWQSLYDVMSDLYDKGAFTSYGTTEPESYETRIAIANGFSLCTDLFEGNVPFLRIGLRRKDDVVWRAKGTPVGIIIRFDTVSEFLDKAEATGLVASKRRKTRPKKIDPATGKEIF